MKKVKAKGWALTRDGEVISSYIRTDRAWALFEARFFTRHSRKLGGNETIGIRAFEIVEGKRPARARGRK